MLVNSCISEVDRTGMRESNVKWKNRIVTANACKTFVLKRNPPQDLSSRSYWPSLSIISTHTSLIQNSIGKTFSSYNSSLISQHNTRASLLADAVVTRHYQPSVTLKRDISVSWIPCILSRLKRPRSLLCLACYSTRIYVSQGPIKQPTNSPKMDHTCK